MESKRDDGLKTIAGTPTSSAGEQVEVETNAFVHQYRIRPLSFLQDLGHVSGQSQNGGPPLLLKAFETTTFYMDLLQIMPWAFFGH